MDEEARWHLGKVEKSCIRTKAFGLQPPVRSHGEAWVTRQEPRLA